jgi:hypothetical protein
MRLTSAAFWPGVLAAWLALTGVVAMPVAGPLRMIAAASVASIDGAPICGEHQGNPADRDPPTMADCALCLCCAPLIAVLADVPASPIRAAVVVAADDVLPPARAPPGVVRTTAYPRGPPASI